MRSLYRRFDITLADDIARLGADAVCYSFIAADSHHLLFAGFYRRTENSSFSTLGNGLQLFPEGR